MSNSLGADGHTVKPVLSGHLKMDKTKVLMENVSLMKIESMAEGSPWSILQYLHFHCESLNEPLHLRCGLYLHEQIDFSHTHICAI